MISAQVDKPQKVFAGPLRKTNEAREGVSAAKANLPYEEYLDAIAASRYAPARAGGRPFVRRRVLDARREEAHRPVQQGAELVATRPR